MVLLFVSARHAETAPSGSEASKLDVVAARGILRVGMPGDYLPFGLLDAASGRWPGLDVDVTSAIAKALHVRLELVKTSWPALYQMCSKDRFDIAAGGISITLERQKAAFFSTPILQDGKTPITRCEMLQNSPTLSEIDRPGIHIITPPGGPMKRSIAHISAHQRYRVSGQRAYFRRACRTPSRPDGHRCHRNPGAAQVASRALQRAAG